MFAKSNYAHSLNEEGTFHSICLRCFRTAASEDSEARLAEAEGQHQCVAGELETMRGHPRRWHGLKAS